MATAKKASGLSRNSLKRNNRLPEVNPDIRLDCLLMAVVCDIRGFTDLTARVDDYYQSNLVVRDKATALIKAYSSYMINSQALAEKLILAPLKDEVVKKDYAVKSTGDGFLVAVEVGRFEELWELNHDEYKPHWQSLALTLARGLLRLVEDSDIDEREETFGYLTKQFIDEWGLQIGFNLPERDSPEFRVAGSMALGFGSLATRNNAFRSVTPGFNDPTFDDAYGHPVNLAFRLCDKAARPLEKNSSAGNATREEEKVSPYILVDRRVARLLIATPGYKSKLGGYELKSHKFHDPVKGIEESWCYGLRKTKQR